MTSSESSRSDQPAPLTRVAVLAIGDELLEGRHPDLNSSTIAGRLLGVGMHAGRFEVVGDDEHLIADAIRRLGREHGIVIVTGGLGPTQDDVTRSAAARAMDRELLHSAEAREQVEEWYERHGRDMPSANERQMWIPAGAAVIPNVQGTAPGFRVEGAEYVLFALPGPPSEMVPMLEQHVLAWLRVEHAVEHAFAEQRFYMFGISESLFADQASEWMVRGANPEMGVTFSAGTLTVRLVGRGLDQAAADDLVLRRAEEFRGRFGAFIYSELEGDPAVLLARAAQGRGLRLALAESCTGGLAAARLAAVPGVSEVLVEGFVTYSEHAKRERLAVPEAMLRERGAVSREVAEAMAKGAMVASGADATVAVTGVAGPGGGSSLKPVGLVWFATCVRGQVRSEERRFPPVSRTRIQEWAVTAALRMLTCAIEDGLPDGR